MSNPNTERIVVKDKDIDETRLSFEEQSDPDSDEVLEYDAHPALRKEIWGWYAYSWAIDGWTAASSSVFMPLIISTMAYQGGRNVADPSKPCNLVQPCMVKLGTSDVSPSSYTLYVTAIAVLIQAIIYIQLGAVADHSAYGKTFMLAFAYIGAISAYWGAGLLFVLGNIFYGSSYVFYASYLPKLARNTPSVLEETDPAERAKKLTLQTSNLSISAYVAGYVGGFIQMGLSIVPHIYVTRRRGPPLPKGENYLTFPWKRLSKTMRRVSHLSQLFQFLLMWLFLSDGLYTILKVSVLFAQTVVQASSLVILTGALVTMAVGGPTLFFWKWIERRFSIKPKNMLILMSVLICFIPVYILVGFSPNVAGGFKHPNEYYLLNVWFGLTFPGAVSYARSTFAEIIPIGRENEMYSMFLITQGGGGWIGPLITGVISDQTGNMRYCDIFVLACILLPVIWLYFIDIEKAKKQALAAAKFEAKEMDVKRTTDDQSS
ncbi:Autophagy protein 22 [Umbelopsis sp. WA50703]